MKLIIQALSIYTNTEDEMIDFELKQTRKRLDNSPLNIILETNNLQIKKSSSQSSRRTK